MPIASARTIAAAKLREFVNKRVQDGKPIVRLNDPDALAVVDAIAAAAMQAIEDLLAEPPHHGPQARRNAR